MRPPSGMRFSWLAGALGLVAALVPGAAIAGPPHAILEVAPGGQTFTRLWQPDALGVADPTIATVEKLPSEELLITGKRPGTTDIVAIAGGKLVGLRIHVRAPGTALPDNGAQRLEAAQKVCPSLKLEGDGANQELTATPAPAPCRAALAGLFETDRFLVKTTSIEFDQPSLQAQLQEMEAALRAANLPVELRYSAATLVIKGKVSEAEAGQLAVLLYQHAVGGVPLDNDELEITPAEVPDAGAPESIPIVDLRAVTDAGPPKPAKASKPARSKRSH